MERTKNDAKECQGTLDFSEYTAKYQLHTLLGKSPLAGLVTVYATQPFDTIKTRAQGVHGASIAEAVQSVIRDHKVRGFWKGSSMRLGRLLLSGWIVFSV